MIQSSSGQAATAGELRTVLMFALQFPPFALSTGRLRTLAFMRHLPAEGWRPLVITARESAYPELDPRSVAEIPGGAEVIRAWGVDITRKLSIRGIYPRWVATPDRWNTWAAGAFFAGRRAIRTHRPQVLWATFPTPSALLAALALHRVSGIRLVADLRDPIVYEHWPAHAWDRRVYRWLERKVVHAASVVVVTTPSACALYRSRYPELPAQRFQVIENGIEDETVPAAAAPRAQWAAGEPMTLVHSGVMESPDRDPGAFFRALKLLRDRDRLPGGLRVVLRASGSEAAYRAMAREQGVDGIVDLAPRVPREEAMREVAGASALLLFQGRACNRQIPAKAYEYLATGRPIIGLMDGGGDTHSLVAGAWNVPYAADMDNAEQIATVLERFLADLQRGDAYVPAPGLVQRYTRRARTADLARLLDAVAQGTPELEPALRQEA